ncbi:hypothetical protein EVAR_8018_1 [Eumeta japonica]|uniref:Uncharacterized protein n=1 Tax=Eumeta variegata TaxID=151549 RepID=A0A4C1TKH0_EUMVA|nr:hypothetical protein EVAR_8018_1 [Eumeta japonica]
MTGSGCPVYCDAVLEPPYRNCSTGIRSLLTTCGPPSDGLCIGGFSRFSKMGSSACVRINEAYTGLTSARCSFIVAIQLFMDRYLYDLKEYECGLRTLTKPGDALWRTLSPEDTRYWASIHRRMFPQTHATGQTYST